MDHQIDRAALLIAKSALLNARIAGMHAENMVRASLGQSMAYPEDAFRLAIDESGLADEMGIDTHKTKE